MPDFMRGILVAAEEDGARLRPGHQHDHRFRLDHARQVMKIAVVPERILDIVVAHDFGRGGNDGDAAAVLAHPRDQLRAPGLIGLHHAPFRDGKKCHCRLTPSVALAISAKPASCSAPIAWP